MREVEELDDTRELRDGAVPAPVLGEGTLLDDFVAEASRCDPDHTQQETGAERFDAGSMGGLPEDPEEWDFESAVGSEGSGGVAETFRRSASQWPSDAACRLRCPARVCCVSRLFGSNRLGLVTSKVHV